MVGLGQSAVCGRGFLSCDNRPRSTAQEFGAVGTRCLSQAVQLVHEAVIELYQNLATGHAPDGSWRSLMRFAASPWATARLVLTRHRDGFRHVDFAPIRRFG